MDSQIYNAGYMIQVSGADIKLNQMIFFPEKLYTVNHIHSHWELHYITGGSVCYIMNFHEELVMKPGEWILIGPNVYHEEICREKSGGYVLGFDIRVLESHSFFSTLTSVRYFKSEADPELGELFGKILKESMEKLPEYDQFCKNMFPLLMLHVQRRYNRNYEKRNKQQTKYENMQETIDLFFNEIFDHKCHNKTIQELAGMLHVSPRHVNRILQEYCGMTFHEKLTLTKVKFAEYLLYKTDKTIDEISDECGYTTNSLINNFKSINKITPAQYRKSQKQDTV